MILIYLNMLMFFISILLFSFYFKHMLLTLISIEFMMINLMMNIYLNLLYLKINLFFISFFLTISVCESVLGLSLLIFMMRFTGNDFMKSLNLMKW
uniref:NADH-ubiquinone oxidoreductase chain 4L n=1 Tax=Pselaphanus sp. QL-2013 TaxID=1421598 RepID=A0A0A6ZL11_9HYME|nr:NADH dehydrogenase subunit 4L [Pselaphanus sp. QL-2013]